MVKKNLKTRICHWYTGIVNNRYGKYSKYSADKSYYDLTRISSRIQLLLARSDVNQSVGKPLFLAF